MVKLKGKLRASTLLEVIVAMVVILIVFVLSTGIYANVMRTSPSIKQQRIKAMVTGLIDKTRIEENWKDEIVMVDSIALQKTVTPYKAFSDLLLIEVVAIEQGNEVVTVKQVVKMEETDAKKL